MCVIQPELYFPSGPATPFEKHVRKTRYTRTSAIPEWCENITEIVFGIVFITAFIKLHATGKRGKSPRKNHATKISKGIHARVKSMYSTESTHCCADRFLVGTGKLHKSMLDSLVSYIKQQDFA
jgi:hypothetical protein